MRILGIYVSPDHAYFGHHGRPAGRSPMVSTPAATLVAGRGIVGDRFFDYREDYKGQVTFFAIETWRMLCERFDVRDRDPSVFRRNFVTEGADLNALIGREFEVQGVRFEGVEEAKPCYWMDQAFCPGAEEALRGHGGLRAKVLTDGDIKVEADDAAATVPNPLATASPTSA